MSWKRGPLPADTWNWGGVVPTDHDGPGFFFADFNGDHVVIHQGTPQERRLEAHEVKWWSNCLDLPPEDKPEVE